MHFPHLVFFFKKYISCSIPKTLSPSHRDLVQCQLLDTNKSKPNSTITANVPQQIPFSKNATAHANKPKRSHFKELVNTILSVLPVYRDCCITAKQQQYTKCYTLNRVIIYIQQHSTHEGIYLQSTHSHQAYLCNN